MEISCENSSNEALKRIVYNPSRKGKFSDLKKGYPVLIVKNDDDILIAQSINQYKNKESKMSPKLLKTTCNNNHNFSKHTLSSAKKDKNNFNFNIDDESNDNMEDLDNKHIFSFRNSIYENITLDSKTKSASNSPITKTKIPTPLEKELVKKKLSLLLAKEKYNMIKEYKEGILNELNHKKELLSEAELYLLKSLEDLNENFGLIENF